MLCEAGGGWSFSARSIRAPATTAPPRSARVAACRKYDLRVEAYGTLDETNAAIGIARLHTKDGPPSLDAMLARIQNDLFDLGADLCFPDETKDARGRCK